MSVTRAALLVALGSLAAACGSPADGDAEQTAEAISSRTRVVVHGFDTPGSPLARWGYDIKEHGKSKALGPALAKELFQDIGMNLLRIAVRAAAGHPAPGVGAIVPSAYADDLQAIANAKAARPDLALFASLKLEGSSTFPAWVKKDGEVDEATYAELLEDYLAYMKAHGITVDFLGVDNERRWNEGNITPAKYDAITAHVEQWCKAHGVTVPTFVAAEDYGPKEDSPWLEELWRRPARFTRADRVGVHLYSPQRDAAYVAAIDRLVKDAHGRYLWDSEIHWDDAGGDGEHFDDISQGLLLTMDHFDARFRAITWWEFTPSSKGTKASFLETDVVRSTLGAAPLPTDDGLAGRAQAGHFNARALRKGPKEVTLWVANFDGADRDGQWTEIEGKTVAAATYVQWSPTSPPAGRGGSAAIVGKDASCFALTYPAHTITRVTVTLK